MEKYYDGTKILSMKDLNRRTPEIFISTSNRNAGKTTFFNKMLVNRFLKNGERAIILWRFRDEIPGCSDKFFGGIKELFFPNMEMTEKLRGSGLYAEMYLDGALFGWSIPINSANKIKKISHIFYSASSMLFDEFQPEDNVYAPGEVVKFQSIHTSCARGGGKQVKYLPVYMLGNFVSVVNPYYIAMGFSDRIRKDTKYIRGVGCVLEQGFNESASEANKNSAFNSAFDGSRYNQYAAEKIYLNDHDSFIEKKTGNNIYLFSFTVSGIKYGVRQYCGGIIYVNNKPDHNFPINYCSQIKDHNENAVMLTSYNMMITTIRKWFELGLVRFNNQQSKTALLNLIRYAII